MERFLKGTARMRQSQVASKIGAETGDEGYLLDPGDWNEDIAELLASQEGINLTEEHWRLIRFIRDWYAEHGTAPGSRDVAVFLKNRMFEMFPYGYAQQACKVAGMKKPYAWSPG